MLWFSFCLHWMSLYGGTWESCSDLCVILLFWFKVIVEKAERSEIPSIDKKKWELFHSKNSLLWVTFVFVPWVGFACFCLGIYLFIIVRFSFIRKKSHYATFLYEEFVLNLCFGYENFFLAIFLMIFLNK